MTIHLAGLKSVIDVTASNARILGELPSTLSETREKITERTAQVLLELSPQKYVDIFKNLPTETQIRTLQNLPPQDSELIYKLLPNTTQSQLYSSLDTEMHRALNVTNQVSGDAPLGEKAREGIVKQYLQHNIKEQDAYLKTGQGAKPASIWNDLDFQLQGKIGLQALLKEDSIRKNPSFDSLVTGRLEQLVKSNPNVTNSDLKSRAERDILGQWDSIVACMEDIAKTPQEVKVSDAEQVGKPHVNQFGMPIKSVAVEEPFLKGFSEMSPQLMQEKLEALKNTLNRNEVIGGLNYDERTKAVVFLESRLNETFYAKPVDPLFGRITDQAYTDVRNQALKNVFGEPTQK